MDLHPFSIPTELSYHSSLSRISSTKHKHSTSKLAYRVKEESLMLTQLNKRQISFPDIKPQNSRLLIKAKRKFHAFHSTKTIDQLFELKIKRRIRESRRLVTQKPENRPSIAISVIHACLANSERFVEAHLDYARSDRQRFLVANTIDEEYQRSALHYACAVGSKNIIEMLLCAGAQVDSTDSFGRFPIHYLAWHKDPSILNTLLRPRRASASAKSNTQSIARTFVYRKPSLVIDDGQAEDLPTDFARIRLRLEDFGVKSTEILAQMNKGSLVATQTRSPKMIDALDYEGRSPLFYAVIHGAIDMVKELLKRGANAKREDLRRLRPTELTSDKTLISLLLSNIRRKTQSLDLRDLQVIDPEEVNSLQGRLKETFLMQVLIRSAISAGDMDSVGVLLSKKADPGQKNIRGWNALHTAVKTGHLGILRLLLEGGESTNFEFGVKSWISAAWSALDEITKETWSIVHIGCLFGTQETLRYVLNFLKTREEVAMREESPQALKGDFRLAEELIEHRSKHGETPFLSAVSGQRYRHARILMENLCNVYVVNAKLQNAMHIATTHQRGQFIRALVNYDSDRNQLRKGLDNRNRRPIDLDTSDKLTHYYYHIWDYVYNDNLEFLRQSVFGGDYSVNDQTPLNLHSPLFVAVLHRKVKAAKELVDMGADIRLKTQNEQSPLDLVNSMEDADERQEWLIIFRIVKSEENTEESFAIPEDQAEHEKRRNSVIGSIHDKINSRLSGVLDLFELLGKSTSDSIDLAEMHGILLWLGIHVSAKELESVFNTFDTNRRGLIGSEELTRGFEEHAR